MNCILGIDTSNYTTSCALIDAETGKIAGFKKKLLPVKDGEMGLRQNDAVFHHTVQLPEMLNEMLKEVDCNICAVAVSEKPCSEDGSYMPCFLVGVLSAESIASSLKIPCYKTTHQIGHILACIYSAEKSDLIKSPFICFHISGGTTHGILVTPDEENIVDAKIVAKSLDLKAGQAIDRIGGKLGLAFPAGIELDKLARLSNMTFKKKAAFKGLDCCLSGIENLAEKMINDCADKKDVAKFTVDFIKNTLVEMKSRIIEEYGELPVCYAGGVMSNSIIKEELGGENSYFCDAEYSRDNAAGIAVYGYYKWNN